MSRTITVTSGKGGVGKTNIALNLAVSLARTGKKVCLFDVDLGLANINILLGLYPKATLQDVIFEGRRPQEIMMRSVGIDILPGSSGIEEVANLDWEHLQYLVEQLSSLAAYDFVIFDTSAGIARNVLAFCLAASELVMVVTPEPTSLTDAYALLKVMAANGFKGVVRTIINNCKDPGEAKETYHKFKKAVDHYLGLPVQALGPIYTDHRVADGVRRQKPFVSLFPESIASRCLQKIAERLLEERGVVAEKDYLVSFWQRCFALFLGPVKMPREGKKESEQETAGKSASTSPAAIVPVSKARSKPKKSRPRPNSVAATVFRKEPLAEKAGHGLVPPEVGEIWEVLIEGVMNISQELRLLRESIEKLQPGSSSPAPNSSSPSSAGSNPSIVLDLAAYARKRQGGQGD